MSCHLPHGGDALSAFKQAFKDVIGLNFCDACTQCIEDDGYAGLVNQHYDGEFTEVEAIDFLKHVASEYDRLDELAVDLD